VPANAENLVKIGEADSEIFGEKQIFAYRFNSQNLSPRDF